MKDGKARTHAMRINRSVNVDFDQGQAIDTMLKNNCRNSRVLTAIKCFIFTASGVVKHILGYCVHPCWKKKQLMMNSRQPRAWNRTKSLKITNGMTLEIGHLIYKVNEIDHPSFLWEVSLMASPTKTVFYWLCSSAGGRISSIHTFDFVWNCALDQQFPC